MNDNDEDYDPASDEGSNEADDDDDRDVAFSRHPSDRVLNVGTRVTVYWPDDDEWYKGTVAAVDDDEEEDGDNRVLVAYDDGDWDWMHPSATRWRRSTKPELFLKQETFSFEQQKMRVTKLEVGDRISVWWPQEKEYYTGTLSEINTAGDETYRLKKKHLHHIDYDDGDDEWTNLLYRRFKRVEAKAERLRVGSRVSVYDEQEQRHYRATVIKIKPSRGKPHRVQYDSDAEYQDMANQKRCLNLYVHPFLDIEPPSQKALPVNAMTLKKRKPEFFEAPAPQHTVAFREEQRKKVKREQEQKQAKPPAQDHICGLCKSKAKRPRATWCHHIFCKQCIRGHLRNQKEAETARTCPLCMAAIDSLNQLTKYDAEHISFKAVEALHRTTAEVARTYTSAADAALELSKGRDRKLQPALILDACQAKRRDDREVLEYYWRFEGAKDRILRFGEGIKEGIAIEQVDLESGAIIKVFPSSRKATEKTGVSRCSIKRVLERRGKAHAGGFFWRFQGETHGPWADPEPTNCNPVEQLDYETGDVLQSFNSVAEAKRAVGMKESASCIREVCDGLGRGTAKGYFWRWKGSSAMPNHLMGKEKVIQIRRTRGGPVFKEFRASRDAQAYFGHQCCWSTFCRYCREKGFYMGYYWQYRFLKERKSADEKVVRKRLRVQQQPKPGNDDGEWLEGKIQAYHLSTGEHEILYDCGTVSRHRLGDITFEWKNDQGQKPVEQLDLKTGELLATFNSISDAATSVGISATARNHIYAVCTGRYRSSAGFFWRYKGSDALPPKPKGPRKVQQLCLKTGRVLATFESISAAGRALGITTPGISYCCNGRNHMKSAGGFGWRFAKEDE